MGPFSVGMADFASEFLDAKAHQHPMRRAATVGGSSDLLVNLYQEIGIGAVSAALLVMAEPVTSEHVATFNEGRISIPAFLRSDDLAA